MKDKISRISSRAVPYETVTPRRPLREVVGATQGGKVVRQANPNCALTVPNSPACTEYLQDGSSRGFIWTGAGISPTDPDWSPSSYKSCAKLACETGRDIRQTIQINGFYVDTRCAVSNRTLAWTKAVNGNGFGPEQYSNISGSLKMNPAFDIGGGHYSPDTLSSVGAVMRDVDPYECVAGQSNAQKAKEIQCRFNLRSDCAPTNTSSAHAPTSTTASTTQPINILPTINPALPVNSPINSVKPTTSSVGSSPGSSAGLLSTAATAGAGLLSTAAAYLSPTPTAVIAAAAPNATVGGLAASLAFVGAAAAFGGVAYGGYKFKEYLARHPFQNSGHSLEEAIEFDQKAQILDGLPTYEEAVADSQITEGN